MNYQAALSFVFQDHEWLKKITIGGLLRFAACFTGIFFFLDFFTLGYAIEVMRNQYNNEKVGLPQWQEMGNKFINGLLGTLIYICYFLIFGGLGTIWIVYVATSGDFHGGTKVILIIAGALFILFGGLFFGTAGYIFFAIKGRFEAAFHLNSLLRLVHADIASFFMILLFCFFLGILMVMVGLIIFAPFTLFWVSLVSAHLLAQYADRFPEILAE